MRDKLPQAWRPQPTATPRYISVWWDEHEPIGKILGPDGKTIKTVMPKRKPIGFRHPNCKE